MLGPDPDAIPIEYAFPLESDIDDGGVMVKPAVETGQLHAPKPAACVQPHTYEPAAHMNAVENVGQ